MICFQVSQAAPFPEYLKCSFRGCVCINSSPSADRFFPKLVIGDPWAQPRMVFHSTLNRCWVLVGCGGRWVSVGHSWSHWRCFCVAPSQVPCSEVLVVETCFHVCFLSWAAIIALLYILLYYSYIFPTPRGKSEVLTHGR